MILKDFFDTLLFLFFYLNDNIFDEEEKFKDVLHKINNNKIPEDDINEFFSKVDLKVNTFMNMFFYVENKYLNDVKLEELISDIKNNFQDIIKGNEELINKIKKYNNKQDLINAVKRYVIRYIIVNKNMNKEKFEKFKNQQLILELGKPDLWELNKIKIDEVKNSLNDAFRDFNLKVRQILTFYYALSKK